MANHSKPETILVLGKTTLNKIEYDPLFKIGQALAIRNKQLRTTETAGACRAIVEGYTSKSGKPEYLKKGQVATEGVSAVIAFTDSKFQQRLDERVPDWRKENWIIVHNRKATTDAVKMVLQIISDLGTPLTED